MCDRCWILGNLAMLDPLALISFAENRVRRQEVFLSIPELGVFDLLVGKAFVQNLNLEMHAHNSTVRRGIKMGLIRHCSLTKLLFTSVSDFALRMQSPRLIQALLSLCAFGDRIEQTAMTDPDATYFTLRDTLVVKRDVWIGMCMQMLHMAAAINRLMQPDSAQHSELYPDRHLLELASLRLVATFQSPWLSPMHMLSWESASVDSLSLLPLRRLGTEESALLCHEVPGKDARLKRRRLR